jgi:hypothetical protein
MANASARDSAGEPGETNPPAVEILAARPRGRVNDSVRNPNSEADFWLVTRETRAFPSSSDPSALDDASWSESESTS